MEAKIKKACEVVDLLHKLVIKLTSLVGLLYFFKIAVTQLFS